MTLPNPYDDNGPPEGWQRTIAMLLAVEEAANDAIAAGTDDVVEAEVAIKVVRPELERLMAMRPLPLRQRIANQLADERCRTRGWVKRIESGRVFWGPK